MESDIRKISLHYSNGQFYVWDLDDIKFIRKKYKIVGSFVGSFNQYLSYQNKNHGLPLKFLNEEVQFLFETGNFDLIEIHRNNEAIIQNRELFENYLNEFKKNYFLILNENIKKQISLNLNKIIIGKLKKKILEQNQIDEKTILDEEVKKAFKLEKNDFLVQLYIKCPWKNFFIQKKNFYLNFKSIKEKLKYTVYKDLNKKGFFLTKGIKFGCDFLAYEFDPLFCHAKYIVICLVDENLDTKIIHTYSRLGSQVNKDVLIVKFSIDDQNKLDYMVIRWSN